MSHLHIPDGVLPLWLWLPGLALALIALIVSARLLKNGTRQGIAYRGALGGVALVAMAIELPLGPIEYHLSLIGPIGVLLGPAPAFQLVFVVSAILAFAGHGGFTVIGLNALVLGAGAAVARPLYRRFARTLAAPSALAAATALSQALSGLLWIAVMALALRLNAGPPELSRLGALSALALPLWLAGVVIESAVAYGLGRFVARVRPDLLPGGRRKAAA